MAETGEAETTIEPASYLSNMGAGFTLWDMPGKNDDLSYFSLQYFGFWKGLTHRVIIIQHDLKEMTTVLQLMEAITLSYTVVVNRRTLEDDSCEKKRLFVDQLQRELKELNPQHANKRVYCIHAKKTERYEDDWLSLMTLLIGPPDVE